MAFYNKNTDATIKLRTSNDAEITSADEEPELLRDGAGATSLVPIDMEGASEMELGGIAIGEGATKTEENNEFNQLEEK